MNIFEQVRISRARAPFLQARIDLKIREILEKFTMPVGQRFWKHFWTISESRLYQISPYSPLLVCLKASNFG